MTQLINKSPSLYERLANERQRTEDAIALLGPGLIRKKLLQKLRQLDIAVHMDRWLCSPGLQAPR